MVMLLEKAIGEASKLPARQQEAIASIILEEIASEKRWDSQFASSQETLAELANEASAEFNEGKTLPLKKESDLSHD